MNLNNGQFNNNGNFGRPSNNANALEESQDDKKGTQKPKKKTYRKRQKHYCRLSSCGYKWKHKGSRNPQTIIKIKEY